jgi:TPR repeat protein
MKWGRLRPWLALLGPLLAVVVFTAAPAGVKEGGLPRPKWLVAALVATGGVLVAAWTPLVKARTDALASRTTRAAERDAQAEGALNRLPTRNGRVPMVQEVTDRALLGIHEAIPLTADRAIAGELSTELPTYVLRDVDADLRTTLAARSKTGGFLLLVGPAAAGKTRCAYEAVRSVLPRWRLFMLGDATTLTELVAGGADLTNSVIWLDETQNFLTGPDRLRAATVRQLLADTTNPTILIGTIWPTVYEQLRAPVTRTDSGSDGAEDINKDAREVLALARRFTLGAWSNQEWARATELASTDPRIAQVLPQRNQGGLTQMLSAAPELIHRWEQADNVYGQAVITAAVAARRCGHPPVIPVPIIENVAREFLAGPQRAMAVEGWLTDALSWACQPVYNSGGIAPLQAFAESVGQLDGYQVSDVLVESASPSAPNSGHGISSVVWELITRLATPKACVPIGLAAHFADRPTDARRAWERAAEAGEPRGMANLGLLLGDQNDHEGARIWLTRAAEAGIQDALYHLGEALLDQGDLDGARTWFMRAVDAGDVDAMVHLGFLLRDQGDPEGARTWWMRAADAGQSDAMVNLGNFLIDEGDREGARTWWMRAADAGQSDAMVNLGNFLIDEGDREGARTWYTRAADAGHPHAMACLGVLLDEQGDPEGAQAWYSRAAEAGDVNAMILLGIFFADQGDYEGARRWYTRAADAGQSDAMLVLGELQWEQGDLEAARSWWTRAADAGNTDATEALVLLDETADGST